MGILGHQTDPITAALEQFLRAHNFLVESVTPHFAQFGTTKMDITLRHAGDHTEDSLILSPASVRNYDVSMRALGMALKELEDPIVVHRDSDVPFVKITQVEDALVFSI